MCVQYDDVSRAISSPVHAVRPLLRQRLRPEGVRRDPGSGGRAMLPRAGVHPAQAGAGADVNELRETQLLPTQKK